MGFKWTLKGGDTMLGMLTQWKDSKNLLKYLLVIFILIILFIEGARLFIHNITTKLGWWMWITGMAMSSAFFLLSMYHQTPFMDTLMDWMEQLATLIGGS